MKTVSIRDARKSEKADASEYETLALSIDENGVEHLMGTLTNLYSRPAEAVFREYVSNAMDSHIKAGIDTPIEVDLQNHGYTPVETGVRSTNIGFLRVTDHGVGMSKDDISNVYSRYGNSTKRESNQQIGAFGLGAKSALAISDRFDGVSVKDGVEIKFFVKKNSRGVGVIHFVSEETTKKSNGFTVTIPLAAPKTISRGEQGHYDSMLNLVNKSEFFKTWKPGSVKLNGNPIAVNHTVHDASTYLPVFMGDVELAWVRYYATKDGHTQSYHHNNLPSLSIAGIRYEIQDGDGLIFNQGMKNIMDTEAGRFLGILKTYGHDVIVNLPIGSVDLTPSREQIMLTERTMKSLESTFDILKAEIPFVFSSHLNSMNIQDAWNFYINNFATFSVPSVQPHRYGSPAVMVKDPTQGVKYAGEEIPNVISVKDVHCIESTNASTWADRWITVDTINLYHVANSKSRGSNLTYEIPGRSSWRHPAVVVYGKTSDSIEDDYALIKRNARSYSMAVDPIKDTYAKYVSVYYVRDGKPDNKWLDVVTKVVSIQELEQVGKKYRSDEAKARAVDREVKARPKTIHYAVRKNGLETLVEKVAAETIRDAEKVLFVTSEECSMWYGSPSATSISAFWSSFPDEIPDDQPLDFGKSSNTAFYNLLANAYPEHLIILVPKNRSLNVVQKANPTGKTLREQLNKELTVIEKDAKQRELLNDVIRHLNSPFDSYPLFEIIAKHGLIQSIDNENTRELAEQLGANGSLSSLYRLAFAFIGLPYRASDARNDLVERLITQSNVTKGSKYSLINAPRHDDTSSELAAQLVALVNALDAA